MPIMAVEHDHGLEEDSAPQELTVSEQRYLGEKQSNATGYSDKTVIAPWNKFLKGLTLGSNSLSGLQKSACEQLCDPPTLLELLGKTDKHYQATKYSRNNRCHFCCHTTRRQLRTKLIQRISINN